MTYLQGPRKPSRMLATRDEPWVSVSLLAEYVYCARAGVIQHETAEEDTGEEQDRYHAARSKPPKVFYTLGQIRRELERLQKNLLVFALGTAFSVIGYLFRPMFALAIVICIVFLAIYGGQWLDIYFSHYLKAKNARAVVPDANHTESQAVQWWSLVNAGFQPTKPQDQYRDIQWHLAGCPWRVLVKGDLRIPVFKKRPRRQGEERLFKQHYARMAAYCHLLEKCEGAKSPYGIVLFGDTLAGMTVPNAPGSNKAFHDGLVGARATLAKLHDDEYIPHPDSKTCKNCPHSKRDRATEESVCGTRFNWTPPNFRDDYISYRY